MFLPLERLYLELRYLSKGRSEFGKNDILRRVKCNVIQGICEREVGQLNLVEGRDTRFLKSHRPFFRLAEN